jgi:hypothetical protein
MLLDRSVPVPEEEPLVASKFSNAPSISNKRLQRPCPSEKRDGNYHVLANSCWELLLKVVGQPLGIAN